MMTICQRHVTHALSSSDTIRGDTMCAWRCYMHLIFVWCKNARSGQRRRSQDNQDGIAVALSVRVQLAGWEEVSPRPMSHTSSRFQQRSRHSSSLSSSSYTLCHNRASSVCSVLRAGTKDASHWAREWVSGGFPKTDSLRFTLHNWFANRATCQTHKVTWNAGRVEFGWTNCFGVSGRGMRGHKSTTRSALRRKWNPSKCHKSENHLWIQCGHGKARNDNKWTHLARIPLIGARFEGVFRKINGAHIVSGRCSPLIAEIDCRARCLNNETIFADRPSAA